jgi:hypothetical protein
MHVLKSPHGGQLTNAFMLPQCAGILEFFPAGLWKPWWFGTLARSTNHYHVGSYDMAQHRQLIMSLTNHSSNTTSIRGHAYQVDKMVISASTIKPKESAVIANPEAVLNGIEMLVERWQDCCQETSIALASDT